MKRRGWVIESIADLDNLRLAFWKAKRGKSQSREVREFMFPSLDESLLRLHDGILNGTLDMGKYHFFWIFDPKERLVCAAPFAQRVLHHAIINVCHDDFERYLIYDTYACRICKGTYKALYRAASFHRKYRYCLKLDIRKYFDSIDHALLEDMLTRMYKDQNLLMLFHKIIHSYCCRPGKGLPIGNLTSQYFANHYLSGFDRLVKEQWRVGGYVRYMDDIMLWSDDLEGLRLISKKARDYLDSDLKLSLKVCQIKPCCYHTTFLGYQLSYKGIRLAHRSVMRYKRHLRELFYQYNHCLINDDEVNRRLQPIIAFVDKVNSNGIKRQALQQCWR